MAWRAVGVCICGALWYESRAEVAMEWGWAATWVVRMGKVHAAIRKMQSAINCHFLPGGEIAAGSWPCKNPAQQQLEGSGLSLLLWWGRQESLGEVFSLLLCILWS